MAAHLYPGFGVFAPDGDLEAVSLTEGEAAFYAEHLSPLIKGSRHINRKVEPVSILVGDLAAFDMAAIQPVVERARSRAHAARVEEQRAIGQAWLDEQRRKKEAK